MCIMFFVLYAYCARSVLCFVGRALALLVLVLSILRRSHTYEGVAEGTRERPYLKFRVGCVRPPHHAGTWWQQQWFVWVAGLRAFS